MAPAGLLVLLHALGRFGARIAAGTIPTWQFNLSTEADSSAFPKSQRRPVHHDTEPGNIEVGLGLSYLRFRSAQFNANTYGTTANFTYFVYPSMGVEGNVCTGFGSQSASSFMAKSVLYGAGVRVIVPRAKSAPVGACAAWRNPHVSTNGVQQ